MLAVNDEVIEVNGIEVQGKTLDQVNEGAYLFNNNKLISKIRLKISETYSVFYLFIFLSYFFMKEVITNLRFCFF